MADILKLVEYEKTYQVKLKNPENGSDIGISFNVVSAESDRVIKAAREYERAILAARAAGSSISDDEASEGIKRARLIASIDSWDFGGNELGDLGVDPECTEDNKKYLVNHHNAKWIRDQLVLGCADISNFTREFQESARSTSKKK